MGDDFILTAHALERFQERFPEFWKNDQQAARFIHKECDEAIEAGRISRIPPLELALNDHDRWEVGKGLTVWTQDKQRGYVVIETEEGMLVITVLTGKESEEARRRLYTGQKPKKPTPT